MTYSIVAIARPTPAYLVCRGTRGVVYSDICRKTAKAVCADLNRITKETK